MASGANLGGWLVMESWLFPQIPLLRLGNHAIADNQEWDYITRMRDRGIDAVSTMHTHWNNFLEEDLLHAEQAPRRLRALADAGVTRLRIPIGYWAFEPPAGEEGADDVPFEAERERYEQPGFTADGFVSGASVYARALLRWFKPLGLRAVFDMHSLPGGAVRNMGYTGKYFEAAEFFEGAEEWSARCANSTAECLPAAGRTRRGAYLRRGVIALRALARLIASLEEDAATAGVVLGMAPWNEALFADDLKANALLPPFISAVLPLLRRTLPSPRYEIYLNFFNNGRNWAEWMSQQPLDGSVIAELHIYHAFDPMPAAVPWPFAATSCPMCTDGEHGMRSLVCKTCGDDGGVLAEYERRKVPFVIGEWSLGTCGMWGEHPATLTDPDFLYTFFAAARSTFVAHGARADFFWTAVVRTDGYDPTAYASDPHKPASRAAVMREAREMAQTAGWAAQNQYVAPFEHAEPLREDYLLNWHLGQLARTNTSDGHRVVLPPAALQSRGAADGSWAWASLPLLRRPARWLGFGRQSAQAAGGGRLASRAASEWLWGGARTHALAEPADGSTELRVDGPCEFQPPAPQTVASAMAGTCEVCAPEGLLSNMLIYAGAALALLSLAALWCRRERTAASQRFRMLSTPLLDDGPSSALKPDEQ